MAILIINGVDYSGNVIVGSYDVNSQNIYSDIWQDANARNHKPVVRQQISGTFDMQFPTMAKYNAFVGHIENSKNNEGWVQCTVFVNNLGISKSCDMFIDFKSKLTRIHNNTLNYIPEFTVELEER